MTVQVLDSNKARTKWRDILDAAHAGTVDIVVERYGKPMVAVIAYEDFLALQDELDDLRAGRRVAEAYGAWQADPGRGTPYEDFRAELVAEGLLDE
jgi:prevent-host-death family protein